MSYKITEHPSGGQTVVFDSLDGYLETCNQPPPDYALRLSARMGELSFYATANYGEAMKLARLGWNEGTAKLDAARSLVQIPESVQDLAPAPVFAEEGDEVAVDRFLGGDSDSWVSFPVAPAPRRGRVVSVWINLTAAVGVAVEPYMARGAACLAVVDALERAGYRCEISGILSAQASGPCPWLVARTLIKRAEDPLEIDRVAFLIAHPSAFRRLGLRVIEKFVTRAGWASGEWVGYGRAAEARDKPDGVLYFPALTNKSTGEMIQAEAVEILNAWLDAQSDESA